MSLGQTTKNTAYLTIAFIGQKILALFYFVIVARWIGVENLGKYTFALAFTTLFAVFVDWGFSQALIRESARHKEKLQIYFSNALTVKVISSIFIYSIIVLVIHLLKYPALTCQMVYLAGVVMVLDSFTLLFWAVFRSQQILKYEGIGIIGNQIIIIVFGIFILLRGLSILYLMLPFVFGSLWNCLFAASLVRKRFKLRFVPSYHAQVFKFLLKIAIPFALIAIFSRIYTQLDSVLLSKLVGDRALGYYSVAHKIPLALMVIPSGLSAAIFPAFSHLYYFSQNKLKQLFDKAMLSLIIIAVPISFGLIGISRQLILKIYGPEYQPAVIVLRILGLATIFLFLNFPLGALLNACDKQKLNALLMGLATGLNALFNILLIPKYQYIGAGLAFLISHSFLFFASLFQINKIISYSGKKLLIITGKTLFSALLMLLLVFYLEEKIPLYFLVFFGALIYFLILYIVKGYRKQDILFIKTLFSRQK